MISRRSVLTGLLAGLAAPAIIRTPGLLMAVRPLRLADEVALTSMEHPRDFAVVTGTDFSGDSIDRRVHVRFMIGWQIFTEELIEAYAMDDAQLEALAEKARARNIGRFDRGLLDSFRETAQCHL